MREVNPVMTFAPVGALHYVALLAPFIPRSFQTALRIKVVVPVVNVSTDLGDLAKRSTPYDWRGRHTKQDELSTGVTFDIRG